MAEIDGGRGGKRQLGLMEDAQTDGREIYSQHIEDYMK